MFGPDGTVKRHIQGPVFYELAELFDSLPVERELVVIEVDMADAEVLFQVFQVAVEIGGRVEAERTAKDRAVAVAAGVGAAAARDAAGIRGLGVVENRQAVDFRETCKFFVGRKRQPVKFDSGLAVAGKFGFAAAVPEGKTRDAGAVFSFIHQLQDGFLAFTDDKVVKRRIVGEQFIFQSRDMRAAAEGLNSGQNLFGQSCQPDAIEKTRGRTAKTDPGRL